MIKKNTIAVFNNGDYKGEYDWKGGIPLTVGETMKVTIKQSLELVYRLIDKSVDLSDTGDDQEVLVKYYFELSS